MPFFNFSVDSALLRELGERLVGKPHIALAEIIKNGFDADAAFIEISLEEDSITISDDGHGMTTEEFRDFWMRIGSPHKGRQKHSRKLSRPLTGSKGVGRLAGQFLAGTMEVHTVSETDAEHELIGIVDWKKATEAGDLTNAKVQYKEKIRNTAFPRGSKHGTKIVLKGLNQSWEENEVRNLAQEVWMLQPPFRPNQQIEKETSFTISIRSSETSLEDTFKSQMKAIQSLYSAKISGKLFAVDKDGVGSVKLSIEWDDESIEAIEYEVENCKLSNAEFQILVYSLHRRQRYGIQVQEARDYLNKFGGIHIYDAGFHLPYYGIEHDWLGIEKDHSHRLSKSKLVPDELQVAEGMNFLPTQSRLLGVVAINSGSETSIANERGISEEQQHLMVQITRDRLVDNTAYQNLVSITRWAIDYYAMCEAIREFEDKKAKAKIAPAKEKFERVEAVLERHRDQIKEEAFDEIQRNVREAVVEAEAEEEKRLDEAGLLGALATAGMSAIAYRHEINKQLTLLSRHVTELRSIREDTPDLETRISDIAQSFDDWLNFARATQSVFFELANRENREHLGRLKAKPIVESVEKQIELLFGNLPIDLNELDQSLRLPMGTFAEWSSLFQNVIVNAGNASIDSIEPKIKVSSRTSRKSRSILIQDTGKGVDLAKSSELFKPFIRRLKISQEREELGMGGTGLGLTIVGMIAENRGARVSFVVPEPEFNTAFQLSWEETNE